MKRESNISEEVTTCVTVTHIISLAGSQCFVISAKYF